MKLYIYAIVLVVGLSTVLLYNNYFLQSDETNNSITAVAISDSTNISCTGFEDINIYPNRESAKLVEPKDTIKKKVIVDNSKKVKPLLREVLSYEAVNNNKGVIGYLNGARVDNPVDNVFHFNLTERYLQKSSAYIEYELYGVKDNNSVSKGINNNYTYGGLVIEQDTVWKNQKEAINLADLKMGHNVIRFTVAEESSYGYKIRNIKLVVDNKNLSSGNQLIVNQPNTSTLKKQYGYINGFVKGKGANEAKIYVNNKEVHNNNGSFETLSKSDSINPVNFEVEVIAVFKDGKTLKEIVKFSKVGDYDFINNGEFTNKTQQTKIYRSEKIDIAFKGLILQGETNTLNKTTTITTSTLRSIDMPVMGSGMINTTGQSKGYRLLPHGSTFAKEMRIGIPYDSASLPSGYKPEDIRSYYFNENNNTWTELPYDTVDKQLCVVYSYTNHFTDFINGILKVPEAPQTNAYTPTSLSSMKAANPLTGVNLMQPPTANNSGSANTGIQIKIPAGRQGLQPNLSINYSSDGGNGWMGVGWDLSIPSIDVETRWGVPRYDSKLETESYLISGDQMTPMVQRKLFNKRFNDVTDNDHNFERRVKGSFDKIVRHGTLPQNYWWEVTDRNGTKYLYGAYSLNDGLDNKLIIGSSSGIAHWALGAVIDIHGNNILYFYEVIHSEGGKKLYPEHISYTGHNGKEGEYSIYFDNYADKTIGDYLRQDIIINARGGYVDVTSNLLRSITIVYDKTFVREYKMRYNSGSFDKTLLCWIAETSDKSHLDLIRRTACNIIKDVPENTYFHKFEYHNNANTSFVTAKSISASKDEKEGSFIGIPISKDLSLGQTYSTSNNHGGSITVGVGNKLWEKSLSVGGGYSHTWGNTETFLLLIDIDGDGLQDRVYKDTDGKVYYKKLQSTNGENRVAYSNSKIEIIGLSNLGASNNEGNNFNGEALFKFNDLSAGVSVNHNKSLSYTSSYFSDVNGDGLVDYIDNGVVKFNQPDTDGTPIFVTETGDETTIGGNDCNIIYRTGAVDKDVFSSEEVYDNSNKGIKYFNREAVRVWIAPYNGKIDINAPIKLIQNNSINRLESYTADGVNYKIQHNSNATLVNSGSISQDDYNYKNINENIKVQKGDRLYFRLLSKDYRDWDDVIWNPQITYQQTVDITNNNIIDVDGKKAYAFNASDDFLLSSKQQFNAPYSGQIRIHGNLTSEVKLTDTIFLNITKNGTEIFRRTILDNTIINEAVNVLANIAVGDNITVNARTNTNIDFNALRNNLLIEYISSPGLTIDPLSQYNVIKIRPIIQYNIFQNTVQASAAPTRVSHTGKYLIKPEITFSGNANGKIVFAIKEKNKIIAEKNIKINNGNATSDGGKFLNIFLEANKDYHFEFYSSQNELITHFSSAMVYLSESGGSETIQGAGVHVSMEDNLWKFGNLYRGWGQFSYCSDNILIDESELNLPNNVSTITIDPSSITSIDQANTQLNSINYNPLVYPFSIMYVDMENNEWTDFTKHTRVSSVSMNHSININTLSSDIDINSFANSPHFATQSNQQVRTVRQMTMQKGDSYSVTGGSNYVAGTSISLSAGTSFILNGKSQYLMTYMDLNGDRYPDIVDKTNVQYTNSYGGLSQKKFSGRFDGSFTSKFSNYAGTFGLGYQVIGEKGTSDKLSLTPVGGASGGINNDYAIDALIDINGDGLPDKIMHDDVIKLNTGYKFVDNNATYDITTFDKGRSVNLAASFGTFFTLAHHSWDLGASANTSLNDRGQQLIDLNGDGLVDLVEFDRSADVLNVSYNLGNRFMDDPVSLSGASEMNSSESKNYTGSLSGTIGLPIGFFKISANPRLSRSKSFTSEKWKLIDFDNDGSVDIVYVDGDNIKVKYSNIGLHNVLKTIITPTKAEYEIGYTQLNSSKEMPNRKWIMSSVNINDGIDLNDEAGDGSDDITFKYEYENPYYDRYERTFYGYETVINNQIDSEDKVYRTSVDKYINDNFYYKGKKSTETAYIDYYSATKIISNKTVYTYKEVDCAGISDYGFPVLFKIDKYYYDGNTTSQIHTRQNFEYDEFANISKIIDERNTLIDDDNIITKIKYQYILSKNILSLPIDVFISEENSLLRSKAATYDPSNGDLLSITQEHSTTDMEYDTYGNLIKIKYPENHNGQRNSFIYEYDAIVNTFNTKVIDVFGNISTTTYDYRMQVPVSTTDISNNSMTYSYYTDGRLNTVRGPKEIATNKPYSIKYTYGIINDVFWAKTSRKNNDGNDDIYTIMYSDGLGRIFQTKKSAFIDGQLRDLISGRIVFDDFGRVVKSYYPVDILPGVIQSGYSLAYDENIPPTIITYDKTDRRTEIKMPDNTKTKINYGFGLNSAHVKQFKQTTTNAHNISAISLINVLGKQTELIAPGDIITKFEYNLFGELIKSTDPENNNTTYNYDNIGRLLSRTHPDAGITSYTYDNASNLATVQTTNLLNESENIKYEYEYNRLIMVRYPNNRGNVYYEYGNNHTANQSGRLVKMQDASGVQEFKYGNMGELIENIHTFVVPGGKPYTFKMTWEYDSWNRIQSIIYPDGEKLQYKYNPGGQLTSMKSEKNSVYYSFINEILYDKFGRKKFIEYGNETNTAYDYNKTTGRISKMLSKDKPGNIMQSIDYNYDHIGNIISFDNSAASINILGGKSSAEYKYDDLSRLTSANVKFTNNRNYLYNQMSKIEYSDAGNIIQKQLYSNSNGETNLTNVYTNNYTYSREKPHAVEEVNNSSNSTKFTWDANGNMTSQYNSKEHIDRNMCWDEENRLTTVRDGNSHLSNYIYNAGGERVWKLTGVINRMTVNGSYFIDQANMNKTLYASPYMVISDKEYTKHYFAGNQRVTSKIGGGFANSLVKPIDGTLTFMENKSLEIVSQELIEDILKTECNANINIEIGEYLSIFPEFLKMDIPEEQQYFYHTDHLGSSSWITDGSGNVNQYIQNLAYGEDFINQRTEEHDVRYKFTGKERDAETGFDYFGARYYASDLSIWLSVDPLASKFPNMSPYMYVRGNPIMFIDKWGLEAETNGKIKVKKVKSDKDGKSRFSFKNKATGENGYIYAPKGTSRRTLRKNMNNKKYKNLNILTWNKKGDFKEDNYNSDGLKIYNLSAVAIQGKIPIPGLRLNHKQTQNLLIGRQNVANDLSFWTGRGAFFGLTFLKTNPLTGIAITTGGEFMAAYTFLDSKISGAILSKYINMSDNNGNPAPREGITIQTFNNSSNYNPGSQGAIIFDTNTGKRLGYYPNY